MKNIVIRLKVVITGNSLTRIKRLCTYQSPMQIVILKKMGDNSKDAHFYDRFLEFIF